MHVVNADKILYIECMEGVWLLLFCLIFLLAKPYKIMSVCRKRQPRLNKCILRYTSCYLLDVVFLLFELVTLFSSKPMVNIKDNETSLSSC